MRESDAQLAGIHWAQYYNVSMEEEEYTQAIDTPAIYNYLNLPVCTFPFSSSILGPGSTGARLSYDPTS